MGDPLKTPLPLWVVILKPARGIHFLINLLELVSKKTARTALANNPLQ
jgi:hypothetical protein